MQNAGVHCAVSKHIHIHHTKDKSSLLCLLELNECRLEQVDDSHRRTPGIVRTEGYGGEPF